MADADRFAATAAHELRTPLAVTRAMLEVAIADAGAIGPDLIARLREVNDRAIALTEAILLLSRAGRPLYAVEPVDLALLAEDAVETLLPLAERRGIELAARGAERVAVGSPTLLRQLVANLVQNAIVHNTVGGCVWLTVSSHADRARLVVENTGAEIDPREVAALVEPFGRGTRRDEHDGSGLGLAIVSTIVDAHGGRLELEARAGGGLRVAVELPATGAAAAAVSAARP